MSAYPNGNWHNANGGGLPYRRPPTVDEALPYSPFTSIIPFTPEIIPFPSAEPPTPPTTLTLDQQKAARKAVGILNDEIEGQSTVQHLQQTLSQLRHLLRRENLPEYHFKPMPQLATPPPDSPAKQSNAPDSDHEPQLSPFAAMLLKETDIAFTPLRHRASVQPQARKEQPSSRKGPPPPPQPPTLPVPQPPATPNGNAHIQNLNLPYSSNARSSAPSTTPLRPPGPAVLIKPKFVAREEYKVYSNTDELESLSQQRKKDDQSGSGAAVLRPHEREIADSKSEELASFVESLIEDKDDSEESKYFTTVSTLDGEVDVLKPRYMDALSERMSSVVGLSRFAALPVNLAIQVQSLLQPALTSATKNGLFPLDEDSRDMAASIETTNTALKASRLLLETMIEGRDDFRLRREELVDLIVELIKLIKNDWILPILRARRTGDSQELFSAAMAHKQSLQAALRSCGVVLSRFATLIGKYNLSERALNILEYLASELLMEQNNDYEKDSVFGIRKFEQFRQKAMDVLALIFAQHSNQRDSILNGIFSNLEKLPDKKASARQFSSARDVPIMTISALFMRFIQVAATNRQTGVRTSAVSNMVDEGSGYEPGSSATETAKTSKLHDLAPARIAQNLTANAIHIATFIASSLCNRASNTSKSGDKPFRNLLDLFIDDFCNVLGSPQWPAADMLLHHVLVRLLNIIVGEQAAKNSVVDKDMALTTMARIGCGVLEFKQGLRQLKNKLDVSQSALSARLDRLVDEVLSEDYKERVNDIDLFAFDGPYRITIESLRDYLDLRPTQDDPHLQAICGYYVSTWFTAVSNAFPQQEDEHPQAIQDILQHLNTMIVDPAWLAQNYKFQAVSDIQSKLASGVVTMQSKLCRFVPRIVHHMQNYAQDKHSSKLRTRATAGLKELLDKDPSCMSVETMKLMIGPLHDDSPSVREATLSLLEQCLMKAPSLESEVLNAILPLTSDPSNGPKKKAIKLLKEIFARSTSREKKLSIAESLILPSQDDERLISELSRSSLEEMWLASTSPNDKTDVNQHKLDCAQRASFFVDLLVRLYKDTKEVQLEAFEKFLIYCLSAAAKDASTNRQTCKELVVHLIEGIIEAGTNTMSQASIMNALSLLAKVDHALFTVDQLENVKFYIKEVATPEDIKLVQPTVVIFRHVLPMQPLLQNTLAEEIRQSLTKNVSRLAAAVSRGFPNSRETLLDVVHCLWAISQMSAIGSGKLFVLIASVVCQLKTLTSSTKENDTGANSKIISFLVLLGTFGQVCNLDQHADNFLAQVRSTMSGRGFSSQTEPLLRKNLSPSLFLLDVVRPFTMQTWDLPTRAQALQSLGGICQQSPSLFMRAETEKVLKLVFINTDNDHLRSIVLSSLRQYFAVAERRSESGAQIAIGQGAVNGSARLETSFVGTDNDSATLHLAKRFLPDFVDVALKNNNELAILATNIIASISRQGLVHPKECGAALVALATSPNPRVAEVASAEHKRIHEKQESYLEKEYMQAIHVAFKYQVEVFNDPHGMIRGTNIPKLARLFEAMKTGKKATFKKFINNLCKQVDFNLAKLDVNDTIPEAMLFARFCLENLALLDFSHLEELAVFLNAVEAMVLTTTGPAVAVVIGDEMRKPNTSAAPFQSQDALQQQLFDVSNMSDQPLLPQAAPDNPQLATPLDIDDIRLRQITTACIILQMVWETRTFVRRCYKQPKGRIAQKDYVKPASRNNLVTTKDLWSRLTTITTALDSRDSMLKQCYDFADLLDVDRDVDDDDGAGYETPTEEVDANAPPFPTSGRGRKRKSNVNLSNTPKKPKGRPSGSKSKKRNSKTPDGDDDSD